MIRTSRVTMRPLLLSLLLAALATSCSHAPITDGAVIGPFFKPENVSRTVDPLPADLVRVVVIVPADRTPGHNLTPETLAEIHQALIRSLTATARFEIVSINHAQLAAYTDISSIASDGEIPADLFPKLAQAHQAQGVILTDITSYHPYPPIALGLRTKLARLDDPKILWATDHLFHASDPKVANPARKYATTHATNRGPGNVSHAILQNPARFAEFATSTVCETLPRR